MGGSTKIKVGKWTVTPALNLLEGDGRSVKIQPRAMDVLVYLTKHAGEVVTTDELIAALWQGRVVGDSSVYEEIKKLRKALGDDFHTPHFIETIPRRGYRLVASVEVLPSPTAAAPTGVIDRLLPQHWQQMAAVLLGGVLLLAATLYFSPWSLLRSGEQLEAQTIAVLPFVDLNNNEDDDDDYLGEAIAEEIIHALSVGSGLRVVARTSSFSFKDSSVDLPKIGEQLGASLILEGSVRNVNGQLRVIAQLIQSENGYHLWSDAFDRPMDELISVERDIAVAVAERILGNNANIARVAAALGPVADFNAYDHYLLGRHHMRNPTGMFRDWPITEANKSIAYFRRAVEIDPSLARAYSGLADALLFRHFIEQDCCREYFDVSSELATELKALINQALVLDSQLAEAHVSRGLVFIHVERDRERGRAAFRQAIALNPNLAAAHHELAIFSGEEERLAELQKAALLDPMSAEILLLLAHTLIEAGRYEEAAIQYENATLVEPTYWWAFAQAAFGKRSIGRPDEAIHILQPLVGHPDLRQAHAVQAEIAALYLDLNDFQTALELMRPLEPSGVVVNRRIQLSLAQGRYDDAANLIHTWEEKGPLSALYEMMIGHDDHARDLFEDIASDDDLLSLDGNFSWGYYATVNAAHLYLKAGDEITAATMLDSARVRLNSALENRRRVGGAYYLLASIDAIEGDRERALAALREAIDHGWTRHWYAPRDPNLESLWADPQFQALIADLRSEMDRLRATM